MKLTLKEQIQKWLTERGLSPRDAQIVGEQVIAETIEMPQRQNDPVEGYPTQLLAVLLDVTLRTALTWIDANKPLHFAREMFVK